MEKETKKYSLSIAYVIPLLVIFSLLGVTVGTRLDYVMSYLSGEYINIRNDSVSLNTTTANEVLDILKKSYDGEINQESITEGLAEGLVNALDDPYTVYMNAEETKEFAESMSGSFSGIGIEIGIRDESVTVTRVLSGSPAEGADLKPGDVLVGVNDENLIGKTTSEAAEKIRGEVGTTLVLHYRRGVKVEKAEIERAKITDSSVDNSMDGKTGILTIRRFDETTYDQAVLAIENMKSEGMNKIILDLRNNGGGLLEQGLLVSGLWLKDEVVISQRKNGIETEVMKSKGDPILKDIPTVVLVNENSASASEIVAGALKEYEVATLVGVKTFGKGTVQNLIPLNNGGQLKVTISRWYTPKGHNITDNGIDVDIKVDMDFNDVNLGKDPQLDKAKESF